MSRASPQLRQLAQRLIAYETGDAQPSGTETPTGFPVADKLRPPLVTLMGNGGFQAVLSRALALAKVEVPWLRTVHLKPDGSLERLGELEARVDPKQNAEGRVVLLAQLLGLLVAFVGEDLTLRLLREVWPKAPLDNLDFGMGAARDNGDFAIRGLKNEKRN
jgi:hypothetical protein